MNLCTMNVFACCITILISCENMWMMRLALFHEQYGRFSRAAMRMLDAELIALL